MKYKVFLIVLYLILFFVIIFVFLQSDKKEENQPQEMPQEQINQKQVDEKGAVVIEATPKILKAGQEAQFEIIFTTHSVELDYEIASISRLTDDKGNNYKPAAWTGGKGGHHLEGVLIFPALAKSAQRVTLIIPAIDNQDRIFQWNLR